MTIWELNDLIAQGNAVRPGVRQIEEMMRRSLDDSARDLAAALAAGMVSTVAANSGGFRWVIADLSGRHMTNEITMVSPR